MRASWVDTYTQAVRGRSAALAMLAPIDLVDYDQSAASFSIYPPRSRTSISYEPSRGMRRSLGQETASISRMFQVTSIASLFIQISCNLLFLRTLIRFLIYSIIYSCLALQVAH